MNKFHALVRVLTIAGLIFSAAAPLLAADAPRKILGNLQLPCSIAVRPESGQPGDIFIADRGAGRVVRINASQPDRATTAIAGFPVDSENANSPTAPGIQSIYFLDHMRLVVAGGDAEGKFFVRLYELLDAETELRFDDQRQAAEPPEQSDSPAHRIRSFHDLTRTKSNERVSDALLLAAVGEEHAAGIWKLSIRANTIGNVEPLDDNNDLQQLSAVGGLAVAPIGYIAVAIDSNEDDRDEAGLALLNPATGATLLKMRTDLPRIVALAYQPSTGDLFAASGGNRKSSIDGIYRIDDASQPGKPACRTTKVADIARPTALTFSTDGTLYVTSLGPRGDDNAATGALLKVPAAALQP